MKYSFLNLIAISLITLSSSAFGFQTNSVIDLNITNLVDESVTHSQIVKKQNAFFKTNTTKESYTSIKIPEPINIFNTSHKQVGVIVSINWSL